MHSRASHEVGRFHGCLRCPGAFSFRLRVSLRRSVAYMVEAVYVLNFLSTLTVMVLDSFEFLIRMVLKSSIPAIWPPEAVAVAPSTSMSPVE